MIRQVDVIEGAAPQWATAVLRMYCADVPVPAALVEDCLGVLQLSVKWMIARVVMNANDGKDVQEDARAARDAAADVAGLADALMAASRPAALRVFASLQL